MTSYTPKVRIVGFEVTPRSIPAGLEYNDDPTDSQVFVFGGQEAVAGEPITFSYSVKIKHSKLDWATRMDHYMNFGSSKLDWESFAVSIVVTVLVTLVVWCIFASVLNKDLHILATLRSTYREHSS